MSKVADLFLTLLEESGTETEWEFLDAYGLESVVPGICLKCHYTTDVEPDQDRGWCEECATNTVQSGLVLLGVI